MKDNEFDLEILENADDADIKMIAGNCPASESDKERMFAMSRKIYNERTKESKGTPVTEVSGVEIYKKPLWHKIVSAAAVIAIAAGGVAGGMAMLKKNRALNASVSDDGAIQPIADKESNYPFGEIDRMLIMTSAIAPAVFEPNEEVFLELTKAFQSGEWTPASIDTPFPDGETVQLFFYNSGNSYKLVLYGDHTMLWDNGTETARYSVSEEIEQAVYNAAKHDIESLDRLIYNDDTDDLIHSVWKQLGMTSSDTVEKSGKDSPLLNSDYALDDYVKVYNPLTGTEEEFAVNQCWINLEDIREYHYYDIIKNNGAKISESFKDFEWNEISDIIPDENNSKFIQCSYLYDQSPEDEKNRTVPQLGLIFYESGKVLANYSNGGDFITKYYDIGRENADKLFKPATDEYELAKNNISPDKFLKLLDHSFIEVNRSNIYESNEIKLSYTEAQKLENAVLSAEWTECDESAWDSYDEDNGSRYPLYTIHFINKFMDDGYQMTLYDHDILYVNFNGIRKLYKISDELNDTIKSVIDNATGNSVSSASAETVTIPHVADIHIDLAKAQLKEIGLEINEVKKEDETVRPNYVIKSEPAEGKEVPKGSTVTLYISSDSSSEEMPMEDYWGMNVKDAAVKAGYRGLKVITKQVSSSEKKDIVVRQSPEAGEAVNAGDEITLYISDGQGAETYSE